MIEEKEKRSKRFLQKERSRARWRKIAEKYASPPSVWKTSWEREDWIEKTTSKLSNHGKLCSCHMCGNPRKMFKEKTIQERRIEQDNDYDEQK